MKIENSGKLQTNWMANLDDDLAIHQLSIPGTHNSGTKGISDEIKGFARTQNFDIIEQLKDGIRFLDIRVSLNSSQSNDPLKVMHGIADAHLSFKKVLDWVREFLEKYPTETVLMLINDANGKKNSDVEIGFNKYLQDESINESFYLKPKIPRLGKLRGKIVLFRRFCSKNRNNMGIDLQDNWENNKTFDVTTDHGTKLRIEDVYKESNTHRKEKLVREALKLALENPNDEVLHITYNSIAFHGFHTPYMYAWGGLGIKPSMNESLMSYLSRNLGKKRFGVIMLDFYNNHGNENVIVDSIIQSNFCHNA